MIWPVWSFDLIWLDLIRSKFLIKFLDRISSSYFLIKVLDPSFRSRFGRLGSNFHPTWSNCLSDLISDLSWPDHLIWSDLIGCDQIPIIDLISWSHFLFKFVDQISWSICPIMISFHTDLFKFLVQLCWSFFSISSLSVQIVFYLVRISCSNLLILLSDHVPFSSDLLFDHRQWILKGLD